MSRRWKSRPDQSTWGDWGADDQLGRLNLIGPEQVLAAVSEVTVGKTFCLSLPLDRPHHADTNASRKAPTVVPLQRGGRSYYNFDWGDIDPRVTDVASDDTITLDSQYSTHWDSFAHRGSMWADGPDDSRKPTYYNGFRGGEHVCAAHGDNSRAEALGIEKFAEHGIQGRGVMLNLVKYRTLFGDCDAGVGFAEIRSIIDAEGIRILPGDLVCFWTGFDDILMQRGQETGDRRYYTLNGFDKELHEWLIQSGVAAVISDNAAIETTSVQLPPHYRGSSLPLHELCLFKLGIPLGELWYLSELARWLDANERTNFLLTAPPLRLTGAVGSPVTPIATV